MPRGIQVKNLSGKDATFHRGPYIGCTYPYTAASLMLCLLKSSLLCVWEVWVTLRNAKAALKSLLHFKG